MSAGTTKPLPDHLARVVTRIRGWQALTDKPPPPVEAGSDLHSDSLRSPKFDVGHAAWSSFGQSVDHLHACQALLTEAGMVHTYAPYNLIRGAIDNAALSVWLLAPDDSDQRLFRCLHLAHDNIRQSEEAHALLGSTAPTPPRGHQDRKQEVRTLAKQLGVDPNGAVGARWAGYEKIVQLAALETSHLSPDLVTFIWRACSAFAHGRQWAALALLDRQVHSRSGDVTDLRLTSSVPQVLLTAGTAVTLGQRAIELYEQRRSTSKAIA